MKQEIHFNDWKGKRLYIKLDIIDKAGTHRRYACGYIDMNTGKYSSKCHPSYYYGLLSLARPDYDRLKNDFMPPMSEREKQKLEAWAQEEEDLLAKKEGRKPRKAIYVDGEFIYKEE
jgi:hypothetical protein